MFTYIRTFFDRRIIARSTISLSQWRAAFSSLPLMIGYTEKEKKLLRELAILFLHRKAFVGADGLLVTQSMKLIIALQACMPILKLSMESYNGWVSIIIYPAGFVTTHDVIDEFGIQHSVHSNLSGEAWQRGPVVLSWDDTKHAGVIDGHNVVIHEFAHKLDMQTGSANCFPPLHSDMNPSVWFEVFSEVFEDFKYKCRRREYIGIDCYAATSPAEFFAVLSEVFFERPKVIYRHYPTIYQQFMLYYRQDPLTRFESVA